MNIDILSDILTNKNIQDISKINYTEFIKLAMESVEKIKTIKGPEKQLVVISVLQDFIKDNESLLAAEIRAVIDSGVIAYIIDTIVFSTKSIININKPIKKSKCCFSC